MSTISVTLPADGQTIDAADVNTPINTIVTEINGNLNSQNIADSGVTPNELMSGTGSSWAWQTYTPSWTNVTIGNATVTARYCQIGKTVFVRLTAVFGSTSSTSGDIVFNLPVTAITYAGTSAVPSLGTARIFDTSASAVYDGSVGWVSTTTVCVRFFNAAGTYEVQAVNTGAAPFTFATGDEITCQFFYEAA